MELTEPDDIFTYFQSLKEQSEEHLLLFHGTTLSSLQEIIESREFIPQKKNGSDAIANGYKEEAFLGFIFLTNCYENAGHYSSLACSNLGEYDSHNLLCVIGGLFPKKDLLPDFCDAPNAKDWQESLARVKSVSVRGKNPVPEKLFLLFIDYDTGEPIYLTDQQDVQAAFEKAVAIYKVEEQ